MRPIAEGSSVSLAFSQANRLHLAHEQDGQIFYRAAGQAQPLPSRLTPNPPDPCRWLLGRSAQGLPVQVGGGVNLYGRERLWPTGCWRR